MAGWSKVAVGFALACLKTLQKFQINDSCFDLEPGRIGPVMVVKKMGFCLPCLEMGSLRDTGADLSGLMELEDHLKEYEEYPYLDLEKNGLGLSDVRKSCNDSEVGNAKNGDNGKYDMSFNQKRKRECNHRMLDWVIKVAKNPCDPEVGSLPEKPKWRCYGTEHLWKQVLLAREAIFLKRNASISVGPSCLSYHPIVASNYIFL
ncbi:hypothetical protein Acr_26g0002000 [Actinidia rufa]|uniref:Uncharacterized protein n=1 Tax=Actinidia rufa TaxID=165716 RepID=A0A7J0H1E8_9ERIC|nr:hypothetical protein Acr_26g0002000 [Actinidia rufa]